MAQTGKDHSFLDCLLTVCIENCVRLNGLQLWSSSASLVSAGGNQPHYFNDCNFRIIFFGWCIQVFFQTFNFSSQGSESSNAFHLYKAYSEAIYSVFRPVISMFSLDNMRSSALRQCMQNRRPLTCPDESDLISLIELDLAADRDA